MDNHPLKLRPDYPNTDNLALPVDGWIWNFFGESETRPVDSSLCILVQHPLVLRQMKITFWYRYVTCSNSCVSSKHAPTDVNLQFGNFSSVYAPACDVTWKWINVSAYKWVRDAATFTSNIIWILLVQTTNIRMLLLFTSLHSPLPTAAILEHRFNSSRQANKFV